MLQRLLAALSLVVLALVLLAWPVSRVGPSCVAEYGATRLVLSLAHGELSMTSSARPVPTPIEHDHYYFSLGATPVDQSLFALPRRILPASGGWTIVVPLWPILALSAVVLGATALVGCVRQRRRVRNALCLGCGYERSGEGVCQECGLTIAQAKERADRSRGGLLRDAGVLLFLCLLALSVGVWMVSRADSRQAELARARAFDYSWYLDQCSPHLTGTVVFALPGSGPQSLPNVLQQAAPGTTIVLLPGSHDLGNRSGMTRNRINFRDLWILGSGKDTTTLSLEAEDARSLLFENLTIDCKDDPFLDLRSSASVGVRNCLIKGYNSGAGGSSAVDATDSVLLIESCEFEGKSGRQSGSTMRGTALELRGDCRTFIRNSRFINNEQFFRNASGVVDGCMVETDRPQFYFAPNGASLYQRNSSFGPARPAALSPKRFTQAMDDLAVLKNIAGTAKDPLKGDPVLIQALSDLRPARNAAFWPSLLIHPDAKVRALAAAQLHFTPPQPTPTALTDALSSLGKTPLFPAVALPILSGGAQARTALEAARSAGVEPAASNAAALLMLLDTQPSLPERVQAAKARQ